MHRQDAGSGTFGHIAASLRNQPLRFTAEFETIAGIEMRRPLFPADLFDAAKVVEPAA